MKTFKSLFWLLLLSAFVISCQKERSFEEGSGSPSDGSLQSDVTGDCLGSVVFGTYKKDTGLNSTNYVDIKVDVNTAGSFKITTDTVNGFSFKATGSFQDTGVVTVRLQGSGKPLAEGTNIFTVTYDTTVCTFSVTTLPSTGTLNDYFPRTTNSNWRYQFDGNATDTLMRVVIPQTTSALGNTYNIFMEDYGAGLDSSGYYRKTSNGDYYQYLDIGDLFGLDNPYWGEYNFLKDYVAASTSWTSPNFPNKLTITNSTTGRDTTYDILVRIKETIQQKDVTISVAGTNFPNTIVVKEEYEYSYDNGTSWNVSDVYAIYYFSRNIGMIKLQVSDNMGSLYLEELTRYQVF